MLPPAHQEEKTLLNSIWRFILLRREADLKKSRPNPENLAHYGTANDRVLRPDAVTARSEH